jgi:hypothetical protein
MHRAPGRASVSEEETTPPLERIPLLLLLVVLAGGGVAMVVVASVVVVCSTVLAFFFFFEHGQESLNRILWRRGWTSQEQCSGRDLSRAGGSTECCHPHDHTQQTAF